MKPSALELLALALFSFGCLFGGTCTQSEPYQEIERYNETVPYLEEYCTNVTIKVNMTDYSCSNFTYNETYSERECREKQIKFTTYSLMEIRTCDATYTPGVNWDPICLRGHYECSIKITNVDTEPGIWVFGMNASVTNGSVIDMGEISKNLSMGESGTFNWSISLQSLQDNVTCTYRMVSVPMKVECFDVPKSRTVTKQECTPIHWLENVTRQECENKPSGQAIIEKTRVVVKYRNVTKPC